MKKRMLSMLLVMLLVFALLPAAALAADPVNPAQADEADLHMTKNLAMAADGTYTLTLESWATGTEHSEKVIKPMDIVLVLDQSGSMDEEIPIPPTEADRVYNLTDRDVRNGSYYVKIGDQFYYLHGRNILGFRSVYYNNGSQNVYLFRANWSLSAISLPSQYAYYRADLTQTKTQAVHDAVDAFVESVANQTNEDGTQVDNRIAIVGFASDYDNYNYNRYENTEIFDGATQTRYDRVSDSTLQNALKRMDDEGVSDLAASTAALEHEGATCSDKGLDLAKRILDARTDTEKAERGCAVIMFTDGRPGAGSGSSQLTYANNAISKAYALKTENKAIVLTIGVFDEEDTESITGGYTIRDYMITTSSDYPTASTIQHVPEEDSSHNPYDSEHYKLAGDTSDLVRIFESFAEMIVPETTVELGSESVLRDVIKSDDFTAAPGAAVSAKAVKMADNSTDTAVTSGLQYSATVPSDGVIDVKGFNYSELYHTDGHPGDKLVVTITGLIPKHEGALESNANAGVFETASASEPVLAIGSPALAVAKESYVIDFNAKIDLVDNAKLGYVNEDNHNGTFSQNGNAVAYQYNETDLAGGSANLVMNGVDSAMAFLNAGREWKQINAIPANNIYFDDDLVDYDALDYDDGSGYNEDVRSDVSTGAGVINADGEKLLFFTFTGTGIDVYCTTDKDGGYVQAAIFNGTVNADTPNLKDKLVAGQDRIAVRNYAITTRYNTPTVSYTGLPHGTYTLYVRAMTGSSYKLDGVRIYNPMADQSVYDDNKQEQNAQFANLRDSLVNGETDVVAFVDPTAGTLTDKAANAINDILFIDDANSPNLKRAASGEAVYENAFKAYEANGPKTEIYLAKDQAIVFNIADADQYDHFWLGIRAPEDGVGKVTVNSKEIEVGSAVDMYYDITVGTDGNVTITNTEDCMIALTNLKVTSENSAKALTFGSVSPQMLRAVSDQAAASAAGQNAQDDADTTMSRLVRQILSSFIQQLFGSISRMFGK